MTNDLKLKIYPAVIGILGVCLLASLLFNVEVQIDRGAPTVTAPSEPQTLPPVIPSADPSPSPSPSSEAASPSPLAEPTPIEPPVVPVVDPNARGGLRVSNQTEFPLRVALLHQQPEATTVEEAENKASESKAFNQPVHWDFAPSEGKSKGLILSLPNDNLELQTGDVLVAFALDGSRRYWGPYVVGQTSLPTWNEATEEWQLILQP